jgi:RNA 3'-terminal phosphate cyclase (ATP)
MEPMLVDGALGEGGGQVLRTALGLATILDQPVKITNVRANRPKKGLKIQHLTAVNTLAEITNAKLQGNKLYSTELSFEPGKVQGGHYSVNIGTAGSISLLLQNLFIPCLFVPEKVSLRIVGGTNVAWSPPVSFLSEVLFPAVNSMGSKFQIDLIKRGYYPKGQGVAVFEAKPSSLPLKPIKITERGSLELIKIFSHCASLPKEVALNQAKNAKKNLASLNVPVEEKIEWQEKTNTIGSGIECYALAQNNTLAGTALGERGKPALQVGKEAAKKLMQEWQANKACDSHLTDQLIPFMALAKGESVIETTRLSNHTLTNIQVTENMLKVKFKVEGEKDKPAIISVKGIGLKF